MSTQAPSESIEERVKHWGERIGSIQESITKKTNISILLGVPSAFLLAFLINLIFTGLLIRFAPDLSSLAVCVGLCVYPLAIVAPIILYKLWPQRRKKYAVQQIADEIQKTCEVEGLSKIEIVEMLAARLSYSSVCKAVCTRLDPEKVAILKEHKVQPPQKQVRSAASPIKLYVLIGTTKNISKDDANSLVAGALEHLIKENVEFRKRLAEFQQQNIPPVMNNVFIQGDINSENTHMYKACFDEFIKWQPSFTKYYMNGNHFVVNAKNIRLGYKWISIAHFE